MPGARRAIAPHQRQPNRTNVPAASPRATLPFSHQILCACHFRTAPSTQNILAPSTHGSHPRRASSPTESKPTTLTMADEDLNLYDEIEIEDCFYDETLQIYHHPCPCGDRFEISIYDMRDGEDIARCPSCSLMIRVIFDQVSIQYFGERRWKRGEAEECRARIAESWANKWTV